MKWIPLTNETELETLIGKSVERPQVIFKHSSRCSLSDMIKDRLERKAAPGDVDFHFLDLLTYRALSAKISKDLAVYHESPQVLLIKNKECVYDESHSSIRMDDIVAQTMEV